MVHRTYNNYDFNPKKVKTLKSPHLVVELQLRKKIRPTEKITLLVEVLVKCEDLILL